jgi:hypothetical protein
MGKDYQWLKYIKVRPLRPYLINLDATGSPCHELTSWDNSSSMSI